MKAILLNGPPRVGKNSIGRMLWSVLPQCDSFKFAQPIIDFMWKEFGIRMEEVEKDKPHPALFGRTPREAAIRYSESFCKPLFGIDYFGKRAVDVILQAEAVAQTRVAIFTDSGFVSEARPVVDALGAGNVLQVRLHRLAHTFQGDSRSYWDHLQIPHIDFENDCPSLAVLADKVKADLIPALKSFLE